MKIDNINKRDLKILIKGMNFSNREANQKAS